MDRRTLAQKFRIGNDGKVGIRPRLSDDALYFVTGADGHSRLGDDTVKPPVEAAAISRAAS